MAARPQANPHPIDPDVQIPAAVRRAAAAADAAIAASNPQPPATPLGNLAPEMITIAEPLVPPSPNTVAPLVIEAAPPPASPIEQQPPVDENDLSWKNRYEAMHGRFKQANAALLQTNSRVEALENMLAMANAAPRTPPAQLGAPTRLITEQEEADMGPEMMDIMRRAAREVASPIEQELRATITGLQGRLDGAAQQQGLTAKQQMHATLDSSMPDWQTVNHLEEFHEWLALPDAFSGDSRKKLLTKAYAQNATPQVLAIFKAFVSELASTSPGDLPTPPAPAQQPSRPSLESFAAPGRARTAAAPTAPPAEKQTIYTSDINAFYAQVRKGAYKGREDELRAAELELQTAMREGRVVQNT